jgi:ELWxxDGT repeat protein
MPDRAIRFSLVAALALATPLSAVLPTRFGDFSGHTGEEFGSQPQQLTSLPDGVVYWTSSSFDGSGAGIWKSDGSAAGTVQIAEPCGTGGGWPRYPTTLLAADARKSYFAIGCSGDPSTRPWRTDGTRLGTYPVGPTGRDVRTATLFHDRLAFATLSPEGLVELWLEGEAQASPEAITPAGGFGSSKDPVFLANLDDRIVLLLSDSIADGIEIWSTDGTAGGAHRVERREDLARFEAAAATSDRVVFLTRRDLGAGSGRAGAFATDGLLPAVALIATSPQLDFSVGAGIAKLDDELVIAGTSGDGISRYWTTRGTPETTSSLAEFEPFQIYFAEPAAAAASVQRLGASYFFPGSAHRGYGTSLWLSDGTAASAHEVVDPCADSPRYVSEPWVRRVGDRVVFPGCGADGYDLWQSDGSAGGSSSLGRTCASDCGRIAFEPTTAGDELFFATSDSRQEIRLWSVAASPLRLALRSAALARIESTALGLDLARAPAAVLFAADDGRRGTELWRTPGILSPSELALNVATDRNGIAGLRGATVGDSFVSSFAEPRLSDYPIVANTFDPDSQLLVATSPRFACSNFYDNAPPELLALGSRILIFESLCSSFDLSSWDPSTGDWTRLLGSEGAHPELAISSFWPVDDRMLLMVYGSSVRELWLTDGTPEGTTAEYSIGAYGSVNFVRRVGDRWLVGLTGWPYGGPSKVVAFDLDFASSLDLAFLNALQFGVGGSGTELADRLLLFSGSESLTLTATDGTPGGTRAIRQFPAETFLNASPFLLAHRALFFLWPGDAGELWSSDGTTAGTERLARFEVEDGWAFGDRAGGFALAGGVAVFRGWSAEEGFELWRTDGTPEGTRRVKDLIDGAESSRPDAFRQLGSRAIFLASAADGTLELWSTDGTSHGTQSLLRGAASDRDPWGDPAGTYFVAGGRLYFGYDDGVHGVELWSSDGSAAGTHFEADLNPGLGSSRPSDYVVSGNDLVFLADDGIHGAVPWRLSLAGGPICLATSTSACLAEERFRVEAHWSGFDGREGDARVLPLTSDTTGFWFFDAANLELALKVLDGRATNDHFWVFYGALSNLDYAVTVTDGGTGEARRYRSPYGAFASVGDTLAFPPGTPATGGGVANDLPPLRLAARPAPASSSSVCAPSPTRLCLGDGRFEVEARWRDFSGETGVGAAFALASESGYFSFFGPENVEAVVKILDGTDVNGRTWLFYASLSNVEFTLEVRDLATGTSRTYVNPLGTFASFADLDAF